jgi:hypothetical protein
MLRCRLARIRLVKCYSHALSMSLVGPLSPSLPVYFTLLRAVKQKRGGSHPRAKMHNNGFRNQRIGGLNPFHSESVVVVVKRRDTGVLLPLLHLAQRSRPHRCEETSDFATN